MSSMPVGAREAIEKIREGLDALLALDLESAGSEGMVALVEAVEVQARRLDAARLAHVDAIDRRSLHAADGHFSARAMVRHVARLSNAEAARRARSASMSRELGAFRAAYEAGEVPTCHMARLARVHSNPRVRAQLADHQEVLLEQAKRRSARDFDVLMSYWERLADEDGTIGRNERNHRNRDFRMQQDPLDGSWRLTGRFGALQGAQVKEVFDRFLAAERLEDWEKARAEHGDDATEDHLPRRESQRRADALEQVFRRAASSPPGSTEPATVLNLVMDQQAFERQLVRMAGGRPSQPDPCDPFHRCSTLGGHLVDPFEAAIAAFVNSVRRVVVDAKGTVMDLGERRFFTGSSRLAVLLQSDTCVWPGCHVPAGHCQADHITPHSHGGRTHPANGAPLCSRHNRHKHEHRFEVWRDPGGEWHTFRPDGTEV